MGDVANSCAENRAAVVTHASFHELIERVRTGDSDAVEALLHEYGNAIRREVRFNLLDQRLKRIVSESDIYQSVVSRFIFGLRDGDFEFRTGKDVVNLLKVIVRARIAQHARFWKSQRRDVTRNRPLVSDDHVSMQDHQPEIGLQQSEAEILAQVMQIMPAQDQQILAWRGDGLNWTEIAQLMCVSSSEAVRKAHARSMDRLLGELRQRETNGSLRLHQFRADESVE